jgi:release factor glutamine methyltransferase
LASAGDLVGWAAGEIGAAGLVSSARLEAELLLGHATGWSRLELLAHPEREVPDERALRFRALVARRVRAEPVAYLLGEREFYGHLFRVDARVLIPRPETELLVEIGVAAVRRFRAAGIEPTVVDVGTGSGAVAVSVAAAADVAVMATDVSTVALAVARENAARLAPGKVTLRQADLLGGLDSQLHVVLANLPYVASGRELPRDIVDYEPSLAVFAGPAGTELVERLLEQARSRLAPAGELALELDEESQSVPMAALARGLYPDAVVSIRQDASGYDRALHIQTRSSAG